MSVSIENLTDKPLWLRLNSGASLHVLPGASSPGVNDSEVAGNAKLKRLTEENVIRVQLSEGEAPDAARGHATRSQRRRTHRRRS